MNAPETLAVPRVGADGLFESVNRNISPAQTVWNLRAAWNVAALNCQAPRHADIVVGYRTYLKTFGKKLAAANKTVDAEFKSKYGTGFVHPRELYMTAVYNHFALPVTLDRFCDAVQAVGRDAATVKPAEIEAFSARSLPNIEIVFDDFYHQYAAWQAELSAWKARYQPTTTVSAAAPAAATTGSGRPIIVPSFGGS